MLHPLAEGRLYVVYGKTGIKSQICHKLSLGCLEDIVLKTARSFKCPLLIGTRQTGKTELIKRLFPERKYVTLDDPFIEEQANDNPQMFIMLNDPPVVYDAVQRAAGLFRFIKIACDAAQTKPKYHLNDWRLNNG